MVVDENSLSIENIDKKFKKDEETQSGPKQKYRFKTEASKKSVSHVTEEEPGLEESAIGNFNHLA